MVINHVVPHISSIRVDHHTISDLQRFFRTNLCDLTCVRAVYFYSQLIIISRAIGRRVDDLNPSEKDLPQQPAASEAPATVGFVSDAHRLNVSGCFPAAASTRYGKRSLLNVSHNRVSFGQCRISSTIPVRLRGVASVDAAYAISVCSLNRWVAPNGYRTAQKHSDHEPPIHQMTS